MSTLSESHYGVTSQQSAESVVQARVEDIRIRGYTLIEGALAPALVGSLRESCWHLLEQRQRRIAATSDPDEIGEANQVRLPLTDDERVLTDVLLKEELMAVVDAILGGARGYYILNQQNVVFNRSGTRHNQAKWHRDYPYLGLVGDRPIGLSAILCLDELTQENGAL